MSWTAAPWCGPVCIQLLPTSCPIGSLSDFTQSPHPAKSRGSDTGRSPFHDPLWNGATPFLGKTPGKSPRPCSALMCWWPCSARQMLCAHTQAHAFMCVCMCSCVFVCPRETHECMFVCENVHICAHGHRCTHGQMIVFMHTWWFEHTHMHVHTCSTECAHTHMHLCVCAKCACMVLLQFFLINTNSKRWCVAVFQKDLGVFFHHKIIFSVLVFATTVWFWHHFDKSQHQGHVCFNLEQLAIFLFQKKNLAWHVVFPSQTSNVMFHWKLLFFVVALADTLWFDIILVEISTKLMRLNLCLCSMSLGISRWKK